MIQKKVRFGELKVGDSFEWGKKTLHKDGDRTALSVSPRVPFVFSLRDMVTINVPDTNDQDDWDNMLVPGIGYISNIASSGNDDDDSLTPQDLYDAYVYGGPSSGSKSASTDKCN